MKRSLPLLCLALAGCGYNENYSRAQFAKLSDAELMQAHAMANAPLTGLAVPNQKVWALDEMKKRGLVGPGRDGISNQPKP